MARRKSLGNPYHDKKGRFSSKVKAVKGSAGKKSSGSKSLTLMKKKIGKRYKVGYLPGLSRTSMNQTKAKQKAKAKYERKRINRRS